MSNFTPGKWTSHFDGHGGICIESGGKQIGFVSRNAEQEDNARLIAAAPEMYELLEKVATTGWKDLDKLSVEIFSLLNRIDNPEAS